VGSNQINLNFAIIGAGLIGTKRAKSIVELGGKVLWVADVVSERAEALAKECGAVATTDVSKIYQDSSVNVVIVATTNGAMANCALKAMEADKHVLIEKPGGRNPKDLAGLKEFASRSHHTLAVGFNHRFHPGFVKAKEILDGGSLGPLMYFRARYGHGGRLGYEKEWRANPELSGGGELLDQGVHLIDLCRFLGGEYQLEYGKVGTFFWEMPVEDNGFLLLRSTENHSQAWLHASCTEWKNLFDFEIFCRWGKIQIWGLGRSYGTEELRIFRMKPEMGPPDVEILTFPGEDLSWHAEMRAFVDEIEGKKTRIARVEDAYRSLEIVHQAYEMTSKRKQP
jgi:predicted dehydrogenase